METYVESLTESLTQPQFSEQRFLKDVDYDDTALKEMLHNAHRAYVYHSSEKACLSVSRRRPCPIDRGNPLRREQGDLLWQVVKSSTLETHRLGLSWTDRKSKSSPNVRRRLRNTNSRLIMTEEVYTKVSEIVESQQEELHRAQAGELQRRDQQLLHAQLLQQNSE